MVVPLYYNMYYHANKICKHSGSIKDYFRDRTSEMPPNIQKAVVEIETHTNELQALKSRLMGTSGLILGFIEGINRYNQAETWFGRRTGNLSKLEDYRLPEHLRGKSVTVQQLKEELEELVKETGDQLPDAIYTE